MRRILTCILAFIMLLCAVPSAVAALGESIGLPMGLSPIDQGLLSARVKPLSGAGGSVTLLPVEDQTARIVVDGANPGSVNWGNEPLVVTLRAETAQNPGGMAAIDPVSKQPVYPDVTFAAAAYPAEYMDLELGGMNGNVLVATPKGIVGTVEIVVTVTDNETEDTDAISFRVVVNRYEDTGEYEFGNLNIPGNGFVSGILFHPNAENRLYARTDIGGVYRYNFAKNEWECMSLWSGGSLSMSAASAMAVDPDVPDSIYLANNNGLFRSLDCGDTWVRVSTSTSIGIGPNAAGRAAGERLAVIPGTNGQEIWAAAGNLQRSTDGGATWTQVQLRPRNGGMNENSSASGITFIKYDPVNPKFMIVGTAGNTGNPDGTRRNRGPTVYYTEDRSRPTADYNYTSNTPNSDHVFKPLPNLPYSPYHGQAVGDGTNNVRGYLPMAADFAWQPANASDPNGERHFFVVFHERGNSNQTELGTEGGAGRDGCVFRYSVDKDGKLMADRSKNISPKRVEGVPLKGDPNPINDSEPIYRQQGNGFSGVSVSKSQPGALIVTTHNSLNNVISRTDYRVVYDVMYRSLDYGETWFPILGGFERFGVFGVDGIMEISPHLSPEHTASTVVNGTNPYYPDERFSYYNPAGHGASEAWLEAWPLFFHWTTSPAINPFDADMLMANGGNGTFMTFNLRAMDDIGRLYAEPHMVSQYANPLDPVDPTGALKGFFRTLGGTNGLPTTMIDYTPDKNLESHYTKFRLEGGDGTATHMNAVVWDGNSPGLSIIAPKPGGVYSPPSGDVQVYALLGDKSGAAFTDIREPTEVMLGHRFKEDPRAHAYAGRDLDVGGSNSLGLDYAEYNPDIVVAAIRGCPRLDITGGLMISFDGGRQFYQLPDGWAGDALNPGGIPQDVYTRPEYQTLGIGNGIENPLTVNGVIQLKNKTQGEPGFCALSADGQVIIWQAGGYSSSGEATDLSNSLRVDQAVRTEDYGQHWTKVNFWSDSAGTAMLAANTQLRIYSDRVNPNIFYAFRNNAVIHVSADKGKNFYPVACPTVNGWTATALNNAQTHSFSSQVDVRPVSGMEGVVYVGGNNAMWSYTFTLEGSPGIWSVIPEQIGAGTSSRAGYGIGTNNGVDDRGKAIYQYRPEAVELGNPKSGRGVYRSVDGGDTWHKVSPSTDNPAAAEIGNFNLTANNMLGDARVFGRVYWSAGGYGYFWGDMITRLIANGNGLDVELRSIVDNLKIDPDIFSSPAVDAYLAALEEANKVLGDKDAVLADYEAAQTALAEAINGLKGNLKIGKEYNELVGLLLDIANLYSGDYTAESWANLMAVVNPAWALVNAAPIKAGDSLIPLLGGVARSDGVVDPSDLNALATVDPGILEATRLVKEALAALVNAGGGDPGDPKDYEFGDEMDTGVTVRGGATGFDLDIEDFGEPDFGAKYVLSASDINDMSYLHLTFSFDENFYVRYELSDFLKDDYEIDLDKTDKVDAGFEYVSMYIRNMDKDGTISGAGVEELLNVYLKPKEYVEPGSMVISLNLNHLDITYIDAVTNLPIDADVQIKNAVATAWIYYYSKYDINRDGMVTLADVDLVRRNLGGDPTAASATAIEKRCDLNGDDVIDFDDLIAVIAAY